MKKQIKILGSIDILLGTYFTWTLMPLYESVPDFIQKEFIWTIILVGLFVGGVGHWTRIKTGWIANQVTWIYILLSTLAGIVLGLKGDDITNNDEFYFTNFILVALYPPDQYMSSLTLWATGLRGCLQFSRVLT